MQAADVELINNKTIKTPFVESIIEQVGRAPRTQIVAHLLVKLLTKQELQFLLQFSHRKGLNTSTVKSLIEKSLIGKFHADITIVVDKEQSGPPQQPPINIEITVPLIMVSSPKEQNLYSSF